MYCSTETTLLLSLAKLHFTFSFQVRFFVLDEAVCIELVYNFFCISGICIFCSKKFGMKQPELVSSKVCSLILRRVFAIYRYLPHVNSVCAPLQESGINDYHYYTHHCFKVNSCLCNNYYGCSATSQLPEPIVS